MKKSLRDIESKRALTDATLAELSGGASSWIAAMARALGASADALAGSLSSSADALGASAPSSSVSPGDLLTLSAATGMFTMMAGVSSKALESASSGAKSAAGG
jgi:hypothetical protein